MHQTVVAICTELEQMAAQINSSVPSNEPFNVAHSNWTFPGLTRAELADVATSLSILLRQRAPEDLGESGTLLQDYPRRLQFMRLNFPTSVWGNPATAVTAYLATLDGLRRALSPILLPEAEIARSLSRSTNRVRAMETRLNEIEPRSTNLGSMVERIEKAFDAADQLPTDLAALAEAREKIANLLSESDKDRSHILATREATDALEAVLKTSAAEAAATLARCESAYSAATSQGLAAAFTERSRALDHSMWVWVIGLLIALVFGAFFGTQQLHNLNELIAAPTASPSAISLHVILSILSVGAPIWFSWLATKQVGQRFRLSEDYAFKASVSRAYEGYRREAARIDTDLEARLLASALSRLDEQPLRLVESASYGSPWHELASSELVRDAVKSIPGFSGKVIDFARNSLDRAKKQGVTAPESDEVGNQN